MTKTKNVRRRDYRKLKFFGLLIFVMVFSFVFLAQNKLEDDTNAANLANFDAGYIISDYQMTNYTSMSEADIQNFLQSKGKCRNTDFRYVGTQSDKFSDSTPPTTWHVKDGHTVCLADENDINGESISHIIWQAAQDYKINPKVLIVLLQKETGIITDSIPNSWDYQRAAGYGCPDTAACSEKYYGLKNQIRNAASLFRIVMDGNSSYYPIGSNYIQYNPNAACGGSTVNIKNLATSALYRYTPYQPNEGALAAGYGTAYCGAYGNRNFYAYFEDWFGGVKDDGIPKSSVVPEGKYKIVSALSEKKVLDTDGSNVYIHGDDGSDDQEWRIEKEGNSTYTIVNAVNGKALDVYGASKERGANVQMYKSNGTCAQKWSIVKNTDDTYTVYSSCSGLVLDIYGANSSDDTNVQIYTSNMTDAQKWKLVPIAELEDGEYVIGSKLSNTMVLDVAGGAVNATNGTNIQIYKNNSTTAQTWKLTHDKSGYYKIENSATGKVLDVAGGGIASGTNVQFYASNGSCAQKWQIVKNNNGDFSIYSACSGLALDVFAGSANNGANVQIYTPNGTNAQKWVMKTLKDVDDGEYVIVSMLRDNFVIDIAGGARGAKNGTNVQMFDKNGTSAQNWEVKYTDDGYYSITNQDAGLAMDVLGGDTANGANVHMYKSNSTCAQRWQILKNSDTTYTIFSACSGKVLDVSNFNRNNGANLQIYSFNGSFAQKWKLVKK